MKQLDTVGQYAISQNRRPVPQLSEVTVKHLVAAETPEVLGFLAQRPLHTVTMAGLVRDNGLILEKYRQNRPQSSKLPVNRPASWLRRLNSWQTPQGWNQELTRNSAAIPGHPQIINQPTQALEYRWQLPGVGLQFP